MTIKEKINELAREYQKISEEELNIENHFFSIKPYKYTLNNGTILIREKLLKKGLVGDAVVIVPLTEDNLTLLVVQPRPTKKDGIGVEVPAGYVDVEETPYDAALRELREETGYEPKELIHLAEYYQDQGASSAIINCYLAYGCKKKYDQQLDKDEYIKYLECSFDETLELLEQQIINDANSIIAINKAKKYIKE